LLYTAEIYTPLTAPSSFSDSIKDPMLQYLTLATSKSPLMYHFYGLQTLPAGYFDVVISSVYCVLENPRFRTPQMHSRTIDPKAKKPHTDSCGGLYKGWTGEQQILNIKERHMKITEQDA
jgi:hypothetical protein